MELAECSSLLGQLQRGRGSGFRRALTESPHVVRPLLVTCVLEDPRWDRQLESRADYYAALIIHAGLSVEQFDAYLRGLKEPASQDPNDLCLMTLCALTVRGYAPAAVILRAYLSYGQCWDMAFEALMAPPEAALNANEMSRILNERFPEDDTLDDELWMPATIVQKRREPWQSLCKVNPRVARIFSKHEQEEGQRERRQEQIRARCADMSTTDLLAEVNGDNYRFVVAALKRRVSAADVNLLLETAQHGQQRQRVVAFRGLQQLAHPAALPLLRAFFEQPAERPSSVYGPAVAAMEALPPTLTLDLAREWFGTPDAPQRHVARRILAAHATVDDVPRVRAALQASLQEGSPD